MWTPLLLLIGSLIVSVSNGFSTIEPLFPTRSQQQQQQQQRQWQDHHWQLFSTKKRKQSSSESNTSSSRGGTSILDLEEPAGIVGAEFFGGNKQKEEYYDPVAEANAGEEIQKAVATVYNRFEDVKAFDSPIVAEIAQSLQTNINQILYDYVEETAGDEKESSERRNIQYAANLSWESCFDTTRNPLAALEESLEFFKEVDVAIVSGKQLSDNTMQLQWQISVVWPIFWGPRVLLTGSSQLTLKGDDITKQVDTLDSSSDLVSTIGDQLSPRFWDIYHIGMTPSAELMPRVERKQQGFSALLPKSYSLFEVPSRLVSAPTQLDSVAGRIDGNAQIVPNHAFSCVIKTMGPQKQDFVPASPLQVQIMPSGNGQGSPPRLKWSIPMSVEFQTSIEFPLAAEDPEARPGSEPTCDYEFQPRRLVATVPYGGSPQDVEIADVRKKLYDSVIKDGLKPLLDANGRPQFFFLQNGVKACYTEEGLGMCVYEWRPKAVEPNEVGIELVLS